MNPISIHRFAWLIVEDNLGGYFEEKNNRLRVAFESKKEGIRVGTCGGDIWAACGALASI